MLSRNYFMKTFFSTKLRPRGRRAPPAPLGRNGRIHVGHGVSWTLAGVKTEGESVNH